MVGNVALDVHLALVIECTEAIVVVCGSRLDFSSEIDVDHFGHMR